VLIEIRTMQAAITIAKKLTEHALAAFDLMALDPATEDAKAIFEWALRRGEPRFGKSDCHRALHGRFRTVKRLDAALAALAERNIISRKRQETTTEGKRATAYFDLNPMVFERK
jgi:putative DNA primase/helicase